MKLTSFFLVLASLPALANLSPSQLKCEYLDNPLGIDNLQPRLSWILESKQCADKQTAYQILAATSQALLKSETGDLRDTGKVASDQTVQVVYAGKALGFCQRCCWKARVWDKDGKASTYSPVSSNARIRC
jgi:alpha-L-rhamnosidase